MPIFYIPQSFNVSYHGSYCNDIARKDVREIYFILCVNEIEVLVDNAMVKAMVFIIYNVAYITIYIHRVLKIFSALQHTETRYH